MYNTTTALASALATQKLYTKVVYGSTTIGAEQVKKCVYSGSFGGMDTVTIGGVTAAMVTLTLSGAHNLRDKTITVSVGADVSGTVQYVPLGTFVVATCKQVDDTTTVTAYDAAYYALGGTYTPTVSSGATVAAVLSDVATQCGLTLATLPAAASTTNVVGDLTGKTCRDMVGYLAALVGCNALIDRDGKLALRWFAASGQSYSPSDYYNAGLSIDGTSTLACIRAEVETTTTDADGNTSVTTNAYTAGGTGGTGVGISIQNPYMTQVILDAVWASIGGLAYTVGNCDIFHGLLTEPGDLVTITDKTGVAHTLAVMTLELSIDGGCKSTLRATGESTTDASAAMQGSLGGKVSQLVVDLAKVKQLIIEDVNGVTKIYGGRIDTKSLFAQDITATGTITGAKLIGAILSGENINIVSERVYDDTDEDGLLYQRIYTQTVIKTVQEQNGVDYLLLKQASVTDDYNDNPPVAATTPYRTNIQYGNGSYIKLTNDELFVYTPQITTNSSVKSYTSFSGGVVSDGTAAVTKKLGMCFINAGITLTGPVSGWTTLLDSSKVPGPQNGTAIYATLPSWKAPTTNPARLRIPADGGLQINRGSANAFWINLAYPIN
jgi:hypothetical protein